MSSEKQDDKWPSVVIYTDGACSGNPGNGGWGAILFYNRADGNIAIKKSLSGGERETTNNKMELSAVINALTALKTACKVELFTDSKYVLEGATKWLNDWLKNGWKTSNKKPVANQDLWQKLMPLLDKHKINWHWVKGHADNGLNNEVDALARNEIKKIS